MSDQLRTLFYLLSNHLRLYRRSARNRSELCRHLVVRRIFCGLGWKLVLLLSTKYWPGLLRCTQPCFWLLTKAELSLVPSLLLLLVLSIFRLDSWLLLFFMQEVAVLCEAFFAILALSVYHSLWRMSQCTGSVCAFVALTAFWGINQGLWSQVVEESAVWLPGAGRSIIARNFVAFRNHLINLHFS